MLNNIISGWLLLTAVYIDINGGQNHKALNDILERKVYPGLVEPFVENAYNDGADQGAVHKGKGDMTLILKDITVRMQSGHTHFFAHA
jgi:hypothetical protein